jgi:hypothetical protein
VWCVSVRPSRSEARRQAARARAALLEVESVGRPHLVCLPTRADRKADHSCPVGHVTWTIQSHAMRLCVHQGKSLSCTVCLPACRPVCLSVRLPACLLCRLTGSVAPNLPTHLLHGCSQQPSQARENACPAGVPVLPALPHRQSYVVQPVIVNVNGTCPACRASVAAA